MPKKIEHIALSLLATVGKDSSGGDAEAGDDKTTHRNLAAADASVTCGGQALSSNDMINVNAALDAQALDDIEIIKKTDGVPDGAVMFWPWKTPLPKDYLIMNGKACTKNMTAVSAVLKAGQLIAKPKNRSLDPDTNTCHGNATCTGFIGGAGHSCSCPSPYVGDGTAKGSGCKCVVGAPWPRTAAATLTTARRRRASTAASARTPGPTNSRASARKAGTVPLASRRIRARASPARTAASARWA